MDTTSNTVTFTDLLRNSNDVMPLLKERPVTVKRRGGGDFCMVPLRHWEALSASWLAIVRDYRVMQEECSCQHSRRGETSNITWMSFLSAEERDECLRDLAEATAMAMESGKLSLLSDTQAEWRATALAAWDERRNRRRPGYQEDDPVPLED